MKKRVALQRVLTFTGALAALWCARMFLRGPAGGLADKAVVMVGLFVLMTGFAIRVAARGIKEAGSDGGGRLVVAGPYEYTRNPMYLGTLFIGTGVCMVLLKWWALFIFLGVYLSIYIPQVIREEGVLLKCFGEEYRLYLTNTPRIVPVLARWSSFFGCLSPRKWKWVQRELLSIILVFGVLLATRTVMGVKMLHRSECWKEPLAFGLTFAVFFFLMRVLSSREDA